MTSSPVKNTGGGNFTIERRLHECKDKLQTTGNTQEQRKLKYATNKIKLAQFWKKPGLTCRGMMGREKHEDVKEQLRI